MIRFEKKKTGEERGKRERGREILRIRFGSIRKVIFIGSAIPLELPVRSSVPLKDRESSKKGEYSPIDVFPVNDSLFEETRLTHPSFFLTYYLYR